ncbi:MAG: hypothetical protein Q9227_003687 [Pyrenula ochraceoflavens]
MPTLKDLVCTIEQSNCSEEQELSALPEFSTIYGDGSVATHVPVLNQSLPFVIRLVSQAYIWDGLAVFVSVDGRHHVNRNRTQLSPENECSFLMRQREDYIGENSFIGREWYFDYFNTLPKDLVPQDIDTEHFKKLGVVQVVVCRCSRDPDVHEGKSPSRLFTDVAFDDPWRPPPRGSVVGQHAEENPSAQAHNLGTREFHDNRPTKDGLLKSEKKKQKQKNKGSGPTVDNNVTTNVGHLGTSVADHSGPGSVLGFGLLGLDGAVSDDGLTRFGLDGGLSSYRDRSQEEGSGPYSAEYGGVHGNNQHARDAAPQSTMGPYGERPYPPAWQHNNPYQHYDGPPGHGQPMFTQPHPHENYQWANDQYPNSYPPEQGSALPFGRRVHFSDNNNVDLQPGSISAQGPTQNVNGPDDGRWEAQDMQNQPDGGAADDQNDGGADFQDGGNDGWQDENNNMQDSDDWQNNQAANTEPDYQQDNDQGAWSGNMEPPNPPNVGAKVYKPRALIGPLGAWYSMTQDPQSDAEREPPYDVPEAVATRLQPIYRDTIEKPYAVFSFRYMDKDVLERTFNVKVSSEGNEKKQMEDQAALLSNLSKEDLINFIMKQKANDTVQHIPYPAAVDDIITQARYKAVKAAKLGFLDIPEPAVISPSVMGRGQTPENTTIGLHAPKMDEDQGETQGNEDMQRNSGGGSVNDPGNTGEAPPQW